jgi:two-component system LytT family response regulator
MITVLIVGNNIADNERIAGSIIGGTELTTCTICARSAQEAQRVITRTLEPIDLFVISIRLRDQSGYLLAESIRKINRYRDTPILFITNSSPSLSDFTERSTYQSYKKHHYISLPITRIDVQSKLGLYLEQIIRSQGERSSAERSVHIRHSKGETLLVVQEILFAEVQNKDCRIVTLSGSYEVLNKALKDLILMVDDDYFLRCHKSFALNIRQLKGLEKAARRIWKASFSSEQEPCFISSTYLPQILDAYRNYSGASVTFQAE